MKTTAKISSNSKGIIYILLGTLCFACKGILIKLAYRYGVSASPLLMLRMMVALPFYVGVALWLQTKNQTPLSKKQIVNIIALGLLGYYVSSLLDFMGLQYISAGLERLILYIYPTFVLLILAFWKKKIISRNEKLALAIAYAGMLLVFVHDLQLQQDWQLTAIGGGLIFLSTISFAIFVVAAGDIIPTIGSLRFTAYGMFSACIGVIMHNLIGAGTTSLVQPTEVYWLALALGIFCTVIPSFLMNEGMRIVGSGRAALLGTAGPIVTLFLGALVLNEALTLVQLMGAGLVIVGVGLAAKK